MRPMRARYENGALLPAKPLALRQGESVSIVVFREPDAARWDLVRLAALELATDEAFGQVEPPRNG